MQRKKEKNSENKPGNDAKRIKRIASAIIPLFFLSVFLAAVVISVANDMYAFVKSDVSTLMDIEYGSSVLSVADRLEDEGIINNPLIFSLYVYSKGASARIKDFSGSLMLNASMSYREILNSFS